MERDVSRVVTGLGGKVVQSVKHPLNTPDFSSFLLQAQAANAKIIALANGMAEIHTHDEHIAVADLEAMVEVTLALVDAAAA